MISLLDQPYSIYELSIYRATIKCENIGYILLYFYRMNLFLDYSLYIHLFSLNRWTYCSDILKKIKGPHEQREEKSIHCIRGTGP